MKRGLVLAGGGSRGAYQIGAFRAFTEAGLGFDIIVGTSVGALNGALLAQGDFPAAERMWKVISMADIAANIKLPETGDGEIIGSQVYSEFLKVSLEGGGVDISGLERVLRTVLSEEKFFSSETDFGLVAVSYPSLRPLLLRKSEIKENRLIDYLVASASCFPAFPVKVIDGLRFIDGGYYDNLPINFCEELGATEIIAIDLDSIGIKQPQKNKALPVLTFHPRHSLGPFLLFDPTAAERNMQLGYLDALRSIGRAEGDYITFQKGEIQRLLEELSPEILSIAATLDSGEDKSFWDVLFTPYQHRESEYSKFFNAVENLAAWYSLEVTELYTSHSFSYELLLRFNKDFEYESGDIASVIKSSVSMKKMSEGLARFEHRRLMEYVYSKLSDLRYGRARVSEVTLLTALLKYESAAAITVMALKNYHSRGMASKMDGGNTTDIKL